ncbi:hypothetical protein EYF80_010474 [Liparis tanakae]|uniref:Uncharacterized protein n=1 Tax=Liparis tanakae TaxID=230148 RepID=A0A4Z2IMG2_9TELE|nr:hypothetical protein EYF80_010474 [Liparis tanakae]
MSSFKMPSFTCRKNSRCVASWINSSVTSSGKNLARNLNSSGLSFLTSCAPCGEALGVLVLESKVPNLSQPDGLNNLETSEQKYRVMCLLIRTPAHSELEATGTIGMLLDDENGSKHVYWDITVRAEAHACPGQQWDALFPSCGAD